MKKLSEIFGLDKLSTIQLRNQSDYEQGMADGFEKAIRAVDQFEFDYQVPPEKLFKKKVG